jgi:anaerobic selenocysteine-containing dehydrogenase
MKKVVHAACPHDCPDACGVLITVEDGRATRIQGDPAHPVTRGFLCAKVAKYLDRVYSPERVLYPMRRIAAKNGASPVPKQTVPTQVGKIFQRISWDEALGEIAERFKKIAAEFGSEAILPYSYGGTLAVLNGGSMDRRFFHRLGASQLERTICPAAGEAGPEVRARGEAGNRAGAVRASRATSSPGASNIHGQQRSLCGPFIVEARRQGAKLVVIDPYRTRTAACADWYLPINPGTDAALALGLMHVIINEGLHDADYVARTYPRLFGQLQEKVQEYPPERVAQWTGIAGRLTL